MTSMTAHELTTNLATWELLGVDVHIGVTGANGGNDFCQFPRSDALPRRTNDIRTGDEAADGAAGRRAGLCGSCRRGWGVGQVGAQEDADAATQRALSEVNVRLENRCRKSTISHLPGDGVFVGTDRRLELPERR